MNNIFIKSAEKVDNTIHLICEKKIEISFPIFDNDTKESIINELNYENYIINEQILDIFLKQNNRITKISNN
jgi:hypothetical protein